MKVAAVFMGGNSPCIARKREVSKSQITVCEPSLYGIVAHYRSNGRGRRAAAIKPPLPPSSKILPAKTAGGFWQQIGTNRQAGRLVIDPGARPSLVIRWGSGSKPRVTSR
ncbi:hypothetical protein T4D_14460 [Trichinella pseudospiralis]|uniref:Uncharacterized protein n=1 Tax=Trichinella pseudospiralis TaxID=6337 RepID=A0A0V1G2I0_TRIPS|nr:hypothetical protein T4D_14460 [Trichinella pseudospiralis]